MITFLDVEGKEMKCKIVLCLSELTAHHASLLSCRTLEKNKKKGKIF